ncbi:MAG: acyl-CoA desaturase [Turneriella sp.]
MQTTSGARKTASIAGFHAGLRNAVFAFLKENSLSPIDEKGLMRKAIINYSMWFIFYVAYLLIGVFWGWYALLMVLPLAFAMLCIVLSVMHDGSHGAFSNNKFLNSLANYSLAFAGGSPVLWHQLHVRAHHDHTNVSGHDQDFESGGLIRLHPAQAKHRLHRFQRFYAWLLYGGHSLRWILFDDIKDYITHRWPLSKAQRKTLLIEIIFGKFWHLASYLVIPALVTGNWPLAIVFYLSHWMLLSVALILIFAMAHLTEVQTMPAAKADCEEDWALHQIATTVDFATKNRVLSWIVGGLNFQIEHHIFPKISHTRYRLIQPIVRDYCAAHGVRYFEYPSFRAVLAGHYRHLKMLST